MISEFMLNIVFGIVTRFLNLLPDFTFPAVFVNAIDAFAGIIRVVGYLLPMGTVRTIVGAMVIITIFRIGVSTVRTIWEMLPFV